MYMDIRHARIEDLPALKTIRDHYITHTDHVWFSQALSDEDMHAWWNDHGSPRTPLLVAVDENGALTGYASLSRFRTWPGYRYSAELSIYIHPDRLGEGIGHVLMERLFDAAHAGGLRCIVSWIDSDNQSSVHFHERYGFRMVGTIFGAGEKNGTTRDVIIMQKRLDVDA